MVAQGESPHYLRLGRLLSFLRRVQPVPPPINMATWYARHRRGGATQGCWLGHYVAETPGLPIKLQPVTWLEQVKAPLVQHELLEDLPNRDWQHFTLRYDAGPYEGYGWVAAGLYLRLKPQHVTSLFGLHGASYTRHIDVDSLIERLAVLVGEAPCNQSSLPLSDPS